MSMMRRVTRQHPCSICHKDSWCLEGRSVCVCMRVPSDRVKNFTGGEMGWIHPLDGKSLPAPYVNPPPLPPAINAFKIMRDWADNFEPTSMQRFAELLGVSFAALREMSCVPAPWKMSWGFPMCNANGNIIGIRVRNEDGRKWAVTGSRAGIFYPKYDPPKRIFIVEGPTDCAAGVSVGIYPVGRPSCSGGVDYTVGFIKTHKVEEVIIIADNDDPGIRGAQDLQKWLPVPSCILVLPTKDLREAVKSGIDKSTIDSMIEQLVWTQPKTTV